MSRKYNILKEPEARQAVAKISPELIPHDEFHTGIWLLSAERPSWYYFKKQANPNHIENKDFIESVDEPLKELVKLLHKKNIKTTPSCSGHHISERDFKKIYAGLEKDGGQIKNGGLHFKEIETGELYYYQDDNYCLPWSENDFVEKVVVYQQKGVLGMCLDGFEKERSGILKLKMEGVGIREKDGYLFIFTNEDGQADIKATWKEITAEIKLIFAGA